MYKIKLLINVKKNNQTENGIVLNLKGNNLKYLLPWTMEPEELYDQSQNVGRVVVHKLQRTPCQISVFAVCEWTFGKTTKCLYFKDSNCFGEY